MIKESVNSVNMPLLMKFGCYNSLLPVSLKGNLIASFQVITTLASDIVKG